MKRTVFALVLFFCLNFTVNAQEPVVYAPSAILIETISGATLFEKNADARLPMASVTKTMTLLIAAESLDNGSISMNDTVVVSEKASSMTGSRVYLSTNEKISVSDLLKSISVSSGNDAAVAMAEYISGSEDMFVDLMNKRADELGLENTNFVNCYGLDAENHYSSARDLATISTELLKHDVIRPFLTIWMDSIRDGSFTLSNTNKLVRFYDGCTGVKTGFTSQAMYCLSASAKRGDMELVAVVLGDHNSKTRFADASGLLNYGFDNYTVLKLADKKSEYGRAEILKGKKNSVKIVPQKNLSVLAKKSDKNEVTHDVTINKNIKAPIKKGEKLGKIKFYIDGNECETIPLVAAESIGAMGIFDFFNRLLINWFEI